jgi:hypothetical protein
MFEPENQIEWDLVTATADAGARPAFIRALVDAEVFVVMIPQGGTLGQEADGKVVIPAGISLVLATAARGEEVLIPIFTAPSRARAWYAGEHLVAPEKARDLFARHPGVAFVLNPGSDYGKEFLPSEIERMLAGRIDGDINIAAETKVLLGHPKDRPDELIAALTRELTPLKSVRGAWLMLASIEGQPEQSWMLGVDQTGDWQSVREAISRAVAGDVLQGKFLDTLPIDDSSFAATLRTGIPIMAANKRGFLNFPR